MEKKTATVPLESNKLSIYTPSIKDFKLKMLIYGESGVGKTTFASTAIGYELTDNVIFINVEGGMLSVIHKKPDVVDLKGFAHLEEIFWFLAKKKHNYRTVVIDSLSELQFVNLDAIMEKQLNKPSSSTGKTREDEFDVWLEDYGKSTQQLRQVIRMFRDLPMHVIFTCLSKASQDKDKNEIVQPALTPKLVKSVMGYMDIVGYLYVSEDEKDENKSIRRLLVQPYRKFIAKDRSDKLGLYVDEPNIQNMLGLILSEKKKGGK